MPTLQEIREIEFKTKLELYFRTIYRYRNGSIICPTCGLINPKDECAKIGMNCKINYICTNCFKIM